MLIKHNYDQQEALEELFNLPMDEEDLTKTETKEESVQWVDKS